MMGAKNGLANVGFIHQNLMISLHQVELGKLFGVVEFVKQLIHCGNGETIMYGYGILSSIVNTKTPRAISFLHK